MAALAVVMLLAGGLQAPILAQSDSGTEPADPAAAVRPAHRDAAAKTARSADDTLAASSKNGSADDPESQPLSSLQKSPASEPVEDTGGMALNVLGKLGLVVALMLVGAAAWKRFRVVGPAHGAPAGQALQVTSTVTLGPQRFLHLVTVGRHQLLVGSSAQTVSLIAVLEGGATGGTTAAAGTLAGREHDRALGAERAADAVPEPADRFEELVLRMRERDTGSPPGPLTRGRPSAALETETDPLLADPARGAAGSRPGAGPSGDSREMRGHGVSTNPLFEPAWEQKPEEQARNVAPASNGTDRYGRGAGDDAADRSLSPGSLFRTSHAAARSGPDA